LAIGSLNIATLFAYRLKPFIGDNDKGIHPLLSLSMPIRARFILLSPSNLNGFVNNSHCKGAALLAFPCDYGAAPVPVPPPNACGDKYHVCAADPFLISLMLSSAACFPISGSGTCPKPLVMLARAGAVRAKGPLKVLRVSIGCIKVNALQL
jgi:hypothetical protein